jgi:hypothetical protein
MKIPSFRTFFKRHGFDGVVSTFAPLVLAPIALTGMLSNSPTYPLVMMGLWSNSLFQGVKQASPSRIFSYSLALLFGLNWCREKLQNFLPKIPLRNNKESNRKAGEKKSERKIGDFEKLFGKLIYPALMMITYLASGSYMNKSAKPIEGSLTKFDWSKYKNYLSHNFKAETQWLKNPFKSLPLGLNFCQMILRGSSSALFGLAFIQSGLNFDENSISRIADKILWAGDFLGGATDIATGCNRELIKKYGVLAACLESGGGGADIYAGIMRDSNVGITSRFAATALSQMAGGLKGLTKSY